MSNHRYSKFWWQDWMNDPCLRMCSAAARGVWMDMLALAHAGTPIGHLTIAGKPATTRQIAAISRCPEKETARLIAELEENGVFSRTPEGVIFSRRMVKDAEQSAEGKAYAAKRWDKSGNHPPNGSGNGGGKSSHKPPRRLPDSTPQYSIDHRSESESRGAIRADAHGPRSQMHNGTPPPQPQPPPPPAVVSFPSTARPLEPVRSVAEQLAILRDEVKRA